jgi:spermidine synthase
MQPLLIVSVLVVATCGLIYELVAGALASYLLGDSVHAFSTIIGTYLFAMGIGSYLSRYITRNQLRVFIQVELLVGLLGGLSAALLFIAFAHAAAFQFFLYGLVILIGIGVGVEIPLLMHLLKSSMTFRDVVSRVLSVDNVGALIASISFPLFFLPQLGLIRTAALFGILNVGVGMVLLTVFAKEGWTRVLRMQGVFALIVLVLTFAFSESILENAEAANYPDRVLYTKTTPYQRVVLTRNGDSLKLYLNSHLQFDSRDEYRYHEALVHVGAGRARELKHALVLGGGDGLAVRELLKYPEIEGITVVELDPEMPLVFQKSPLLAELNGGAFLNPKVTVVSEDAFLWLRSPPKRFDLIIVDFPDPTTYALGKLYTTAFYRLLKGALSPGGVAVIQSTSPLLARSSYWCIVNTIQSVGLHTAPFHAYVPSFGEWGFVLASVEESARMREQPEGLRFIDNTVLPSLFFFPKDMEPVETEVNRLNNQALVRYYEKEWAKWGL